MPLATQIIRDGEPLKLHWGEFHVAAMALAASFDSEDCGNAISAPEKIYEGHGDPREWECYPDAPFPVSQLVAFLLSSYAALSNTPLSGGEYTLKGKHKFHDQADGEVLELLPGDVLKAWEVIPGGA